VSDRPLEYCCECDAPTDHAGAGEDSLYAGDRGPFCDECWSDLPDKLVEEIASLQQQLEKARWVPAIELEEYEAGYLNDYGGGNVEWWQDYIRGELGRAYEFYQDRIQIVPPAPDTEE